MISVKKDYFILFQIYTELRFKGDYMNIKKLKRILKRKGIAEYHYRICEKGIDDDKINLDYEDGKWIVYYSERGKVFDKKIFDSESEACEEALAQIIYIYD